MGTTGYQPGWQVTLVRKVRHSDGFQVWTTEQYVDDVELAHTVLPWLLGDRVDVSNLEPGSFEGDYLVSLNSELVDELNRSGHFEVEDELFVVYIDRDAR